MDERGAGGAGRWTVLLNIMGRVSATLTGRPAARAPSAASSASARMNSLPPKPPPMKGETKRTFSLGIPSVVARSPTLQSIIWLDVQSVKPDRKKAALAFHHRAGAVLLSDAQKPSVFEAPG